MADFLKAANVAGGARRGPYVAPNHCTAVRRLRVAAGFTQVEAASRAGVSLRTFQRADSGDVVDRSTLRRIERALGAGW